jgi:hypothetical protein
MTIQQAIAAVPQSLGLFELRKLKIGHTSPGIPAWDFDEYTTQKVAST